MSNLVVEIHVPLIAPPDLDAGSYPFPWIDEIEEFLSDLEDQGQVEIYDDHEEFDGSYVFFLTGADESALLSVASRVATHEGVPTGAFAMVTDCEAEEFGLGRRVPLPLA